MCQIEPSPFTHGRTRGTGGGVEDERMRDYDKNLGRVLMLLMILAGIVALPVYWEQYHHAPYLFITYVGGLLIWVGISVLSFLKPGSKAFLILLFAGTGINICTLALVTYENYYDVLERSIRYIATYLLVNAFLLLPGILLIALSALCLIKRSRGKEVRYVLHRVLRIILIIPFTIYVLESLISIILTRFSFKVSTMMGYYIFLFYGAAVLHLFCTALATAPNEENIGRN